MAEPQPGAIARAPGLPIYLAAALVLGWLAAADVGFRDSGELGTAAFGLGVAHPTGFGVDLLILRAFSYLPLGHIAFRQNLAVALEAAGALTLLALLCDRLALRLGVHTPSARWGGALLACCGLACFRTFFETATSVEVYSLALLAALLAVYGAVAGGRARGLCCVVLGLAPGLHVTAGLFAALVLLGLLVRLGPSSGLRFVRARLLLVVAGALVIAYLPLASLRNPALDWGDPDTFGRVLAHLTAARIRSAYHGEMLSSDPNASLGVLSQLFELWPLLPVALLALLLGWSRSPRALLLPLALLTADLAYAVWINPMGAADRQVGHMAGAALALLAGLGAALLQAAARRARSRALYALALGAVLGLLLWRFPRSELADRYAAAELLGSGGPLCALPPRTVLLCSSDDGCAGGLFALYVEAVRPDVDVAPAQHLWDATVLRRLRGLQLPPQSTGELSPAQRAAAASDVLRFLVSHRARRPLRLESTAPLRWSRLRVVTRAADPPPYLRVGTGTQWPALSPPILAQLDALRAARLPGGLARAERAREAWSRAYGALGEQALGSASAVRALRTAAQLAPERAVAWTNLGVALEAVGDADGAIACARRAIALAPRRATGWLNLARLTLARQGPEAARRVLQLAASAGVHDRRLSRLQSQLDRAGVR